jgi:hypothetical protein
MARTSPLTKEGLANKKSVQIDPLEYIEITSIEIALLPPIQEAQTSASIKLDDGLLSTFSDATADLKFRQVPRYGYRAK